MHLTDESFESIEHFIRHNKAADGNSGLIMKYRLPQEIKIVISDHSYLDLPSLLLTVDWDSLLRRQKLILTYFIIRDVFGADDTSASYARTNPFYFKL